jgi:hypothetical protein
MTDNSRHQTPTLSELYSRPRRSAAWEEQAPPVVRFWTDDGDSWAFVFHHLVGVHYGARQEQLSITWPLGTIVITGSKVSAFYEDFCNHRATSVKADGKDILSVTMHLKADKEADLEE